MMDISKQQIADIRAILNKPIHSNNSCECNDCDEVRKSPGFNTFNCDDCGYVGPPSLFRCECYDSSCRGLGGSGNAAGCPHGFAFCPVCEDGNLDFSELVKEIRNVVT